VFTTASKGASEYSAKLIEMMKANTSASLDFAQSLFGVKSPSEALELWTTHARKQCVIGIDDWAWRRNQRYGTIICDLERRQPITLLPDREPATAQAWLAGQPQITVVARDRGGSYALATAKALPHATQVADRWHLIENASHAFLDAVRKSMRQVRAAVGAGTINPELLTTAERIQYEGYLRHEDTNAAILKQAEVGASIKEIVRLTGHSRGLVRRVLRGQRSDVFRVRESSLEHHLSWLDVQWTADHRMESGDNLSSLHQERNAVLDRGDGDGL
jgi:transposase